VFLLAEGVRLGSLTGIRRQSFALIHSESVADVANDAGKEEKRR
jgi:hypothetical protein